MKPDHLLISLVVFVVLALLSVGLLIRYGISRESAVSGNPTGGSSVVTSTTQGTLGESTATHATTTPPAPVPKSGIMGTVTLGPTCPVERIPPDPQCAPKSYETSIGIYVNSTLVGLAKTDSNGNFKVNILPGTYDLEPSGGNPYPSCRTQAVTVPKDNYVTVNLSCDTGIR